ncbi:hypothetical protein NBRC116591_23430 [Sessilibacter corallicola]|uniref:Uncharacterized protein n=1 Tax=Sessilibacter corallicola TaxID=2904075 RepID=A0ABQ0AA40_9GAMM
MFEKAVKFFAVTYLLLALLSLVLGSLLIYGVEYGYQPDNYVERYLYGPMMNRLIELIFA